MFFYSIVLYRYLGNLFCKNTIYGKGERVMLHFSLQYTYAPPYVYPILLTFHNDSVY
jgi:hypothetical protein